jgi:hypothetical protein
VRGATVRAIPTVPQHCRGAARAFLREQHCIARDGACVIVACASRTQRTATHGSITHGTATKPLVASANAS